MVYSDCKESIWKSQKTCEDPVSKLVSFMCGYARCDCPNPLVLDTKTGYCYALEDCPVDHTVDTMVVTDPK